MFAIFLRSIFTSLISFFGFETMLNFRSSLFWFICFFLIVLLMMIVSVIKICRIKSDRHHHIFFPFFCFLSGVIFFVFIPGGAFQQVYAVLASLFFGALLFYIGNFILGHTEVKKTYRHLTLFDIVALIFSFLSYSSLFGLYLFLAWSTWLLIFLSFILSIILFYYYFWYHRISHAKNLLYYFIFGLVALEVAWSMTFWSTGYLARGLVLFIIFYLFSGLLKHHHQKTLTKSMVREYLITAAVVLALVLGTTRWTF